MRVQSFTIVLFLFFSGFANAYQPFDCHEKNSGSHASESACLERMAKNSALQVTSAFNLIKKRISAWDANPEERAAVLKTVKISQLHYEQYRKSQCEFVFSAVNGGNTAGDSRLRCQIQLDAARFELLRDQSDWFIH